jgi:hypothetical protein
MVFNDDQQSWSAFLATLPRDLRCRCGWDVRGECVSPRCQLTPGEVRAELERLGVDTRPAVRRVLEALARRQKIQAEGEG